MVFSSAGFIFVFLPIVFTCYFLLLKLKSNFYAKCFLVLASFIFYAIGSPNFVLIFMLSVGINYLIGSRISVMESVKLKKVLLIIGILLNVFLLGYYKYTDFFIANYNFLFGKNVKYLNIVLPIGISFFTFQLIAYLVDSYRSLTSSYKFLDYLLFITFFPQLIVGPIVHHSEMVPQFESTENLKINWDNIAKGLFVFTIGFAKKAILADPLTVNAQSYFDSIGSVSALLAWWYSIEYTVSYYFDLSAYADMAIGIGLLFNIKIPENFNSPYKARNFKDYWQRWHITLSRFLGAYIFKSVYRKDNKFRSYYVATMVTFLVSGFWHGAGWNFVIWGLINGFFVCTASWMQRKGKSYPPVIAHALTIIGFILMRVLFVSSSFSDAMVVFSSLFNFSAGSVVLGNGINKLVALRLLIGILIIAFAPTTKQMTEEFSTTWKRLTFIVLLAGIAIMFIGSSQSFLYFQF